MTDPPSPCTSSRTNISGTVTHAGLLYHWSTAAAVTRPYSLTGHAVCCRLDRLLGLDSFGTPFVAMPLVAFAVA